MVEDCTFSKKKEVLKHERESLPLLAMRFITKQYLESLSRGPSS